MNKARAMLDALMGPGRDTATRDKAQSKAKFKDDSVCKSFLIGLCPFASENLGGKRGFKVCDKIHSEIMKQQFEESKEGLDLMGEYESAALPILERIVQDCDGRVSAEKDRCRRDWQNKKPAMPARFYAIKKEREALIKEAEELGDDKVQERAQLMQKAEELEKESVALVEAETKKEMELATPEEVCEVCATCYRGSTADAAHRAFRIHMAYKAIREQLEHMRPRVEGSRTPSTKNETRDSRTNDGSKIEKTDVEVEEQERSKLNGARRSKSENCREEERDRERRRRGREVRDMVADRTGGNSRRRENDHDRDRHGERDQRRSHDRDRDRDRDQDRKSGRTADREMERQRDREHVKANERDRNRDTARGSDRQRDRNRSRGRDRQRSRSRSREHSRKHK